MPFIEGFCEFFRGNMVQKWPIWGHHTPLHRFYGITRWKKERKEIAFLYTAIPPCSQWPSLSGKLHVYKIRGVQLKSKKLIIFCKKWELLWPLFTLTNQNQNLIYRRVYIQCVPGTNVHRILHCSTLLSSIRLFDHWLLSSPIDAWVLTQCHCW